MSEILEMIPRYTAHEWSIDRYSKTYQGYCKALMAGDRLFNMLQEVFKNICKDINLQRGLFHVRESSADELFSQTLEWIFPMPFEDTFNDIIDDEDDRREQKSYGLIWDGKDRNYTYRIEVSVLAEIFESECPEDIECSGKISREDHDNNVEFWYAEERVWRKYGKRLSI